MKALLRFSRLRLFVLLDQRPSRWRGLGRTLFVYEKCLLEPKVVAK